MADDNSKKKYTEEENKKRLQHMGSVQPPSFFQKRGIKNVDKPIRPGASADSTGYFAKKYDDLQKMEDSYIKELRDSKAPITKIPEEIKNRKLGKFDEFAYKYISSQPEVLGKIRAAQAEAKDNYFRQSEKGEKGVIFNYDKDGHYVGPFGGGKEAKKEMKPAKIVSPVKRPSEAVMKKLTGKK